MPQRQTIFKPCFRLVLLAVIAIAALLAVGCSNAAMRTNPFAAPTWESNRNDNQEWEGHAPLAPSMEHTNVWPIYYRDGDAYSALWPLIAVTPAGHAFVPFYEYLKKEQTLRIIALHQWIPALAVIDKANDSWRILNLQYNGQTPRRLMFHPLYYHTFDESLLILPFFFGNDQGFWTPIYTNYDEFLGVLGPLFFRHDNGWRKTYWYPFPFLRHWKEPGDWGTQLFPVWYFSRESDGFVFNLLGLILHLNKQSENDWAYHYLLPLGKVSHDGPEFYNYLIPLWFYHCNANKKWFLSLLTWYYSNIRGDKTVISPLGIDIQRENMRRLWAGWFLYQLNRRGESVHRSVLWPFFHQFEDNQIWGHTLLPIYHYQREKGAEARLLTPLFGFKTDGSLLNVLGPVFIRTTSTEGRYLTVLWPIFQKWNLEHKQGSMLLPIYYANKRSENNGRTFMTPLFGWDRDDESSFHHVLGPVHFYNKNYLTDKEVLAVLFPIFTRIAQGDKVTTILFPIYANVHSAKRDGFYTIPLSFGRKGEDRFVNLFWFLARWKGRSDYHSFTMLLSLIGYERDKTYDSRAWWLIPLAHWERNRNAREAGLLLNSIGYIRNPDLGNLSWWFGWFLLTYERNDIERKFSWLVARHERVRAEKRKDLYVDDYLRRVLSGSAPDRLMTALEEGRPYHVAGFPVKIDKMILNFIYRREDLGATIHRFDGGVPIAPGDRIVTGAEGNQARFEFVKVKEWGIFPYFKYFPILRHLGEFIHYESDPRFGKKFNIIWSLYDSDVEYDESGDESYSRRSVLWYLWRRVREGAHVRTDVFPFMVFDREENASRFSFAGGLLEFGKRDGKRNFKLFWIPLKK